MLAALVNSPTDEKSWLEWSFHNADQHNLIVSSLFNQQGVSLPAYVLDPIPSFDIANWLRRHQDIHLRQNAVLGIAGSDLTDVDFQNKAQLEAWVQLHFVEHLAASSKLGLG